MDAAVRVLPEGEVMHFDALAVSLVGTATLDWCTKTFGLNADPRRLRVNIVVETSEPFIEETWVGDQIEIGTVTFGVNKRVKRCRMIDVDQDGVVADGRWLKQLGGERATCAAVYLDVLRPGHLSVGDPVLTQQHAE